MNLAIRLADLGGSVDDLGQVGEIVGDVASEGVSQVLGQALDGLGAGGDGLDSKANKGNLRRRRRCVVGLS